MGRPDCRRSSTPDFRGPILDSPAELSLSAAAIETALKCRTSARERASVHRVAGTLTMRTGSVSEFPEHLNLYARALNLMGRWQRNGLEIARSEYQHVP